MKYTIRKAERRDIPQLISMFKEFSIFEKKAEKMINSALKMEKEFDYFKGLIACNQEDKIVGYLSYFFCYYTWSGKSLYMDDFYVKPEHRGQGIGIGLLHTLIEMGKKENCYKIRWQVAKWNKDAIQFYKSVGAEIEDVELDCDLIL